jgi:hypothetical protein
MSRSAPESAVTSLAAVVVGQDVEIVRVRLRDGTSSDPQHRLRPGRHWHCSYSGSATMLLVNDTGETIRVSRDAARYIEVSAVAAESFGAPSRRSIRRRQP